jgi:GNAT superfamily N-acetyltransferase
MPVSQVPGGVIASVMTALEMTERPRPDPMPASPFRLVRWEQPGPERYRALFSRIGLPWLWFSPLALGDARLTATIHDPKVKIWAVQDLQGIEVGMLELDFRRAGTCKICYFGFIPELTGKGHGRWLMANALAAAWRKDVKRVWLTTCTLDHPSALNFYVKQGFRAFRRVLETFDDPRLTGLIPRDAAPHVPIIE